MADRVLVDFPSMEYACYFPDLESLLRDSTSRFLAAVSAAPAAPNRDLPRFRPIFSRVLGAYRDPPLEAVWFFAAVTFRDAPDDVRGILRLLSAFTASSPTAAKPLALLAPVISELFHSAKPRRVIQALVEDVLRYISTCSSRAARGEDNAYVGRLLPVFGELVKVWNVRKTMGRCPFQVLFPLVGSEARQELMKEGCSVAFLAGVVVAEAFLLSLCVKVQGAAAGVPRSELQNELRIWAVSSILAYQNQQFFERSRKKKNLQIRPSGPRPRRRPERPGDAPPPLLHKHACPWIGASPSTAGKPPDNPRRTPSDAVAVAKLQRSSNYSLLSADDEMLVRDVLYDALILVDYSSLSGAKVDRADSSLFPIFVPRLVIAVDAINDARRKGDQGREMLYINAFSTSNIPSYLVGWAIRRAGTDQLGKRIAMTPQAFLEWLVDLEEKGLLIVFGENRLGIKDRLTQDEDRKDNHSRISQSDADFFFIDK